MKETAKINIKVVKPRPALLQIESHTKFKVEEEHNLEMVMEKIRVLSHPRQEREEVPGGKERQDDGDDDK